MQKRTSWDEDMEAGAIVKRARRAAGLTQRRLAELTGIQQAAIARIERGQIQPRTDTLDRLLRAAGWDLYLAPRPSGEVDRAEIRLAVRMSDADRERYYLVSNRNMLRLFAAARPAK
jgi:transcriptional regulator with XRE-family HTH domain